MAETKFCTVRFNLENPYHRKAWECLQTMDRDKHKSYSNVVSIAIVEYFERYNKLKNDPYFETREREERFVEQILDAVQEGLAKAAFSKFMPTIVPKTNEENPQESYVSNESDIDWDFLGN